MKEEELVGKYDICGFLDNSDLDNMIAILATKAELKAKQDEIVKLQAFDSSHFRVKIHFEYDGRQNYLVFQPLYRYFKKLY